MSMSRIATQSAIVLGALLLLPTASASASPNWLPDEVIVEGVPPSLLTQEDAVFLEETAAEPGDILPVQWIAGPDCEAKLCPYVTGSDGLPIQIRSGSLAVAPHGPDGPTGGTAYPGYDDLVSYDTGSDGLLGHGPYDRNPSTVGIAFVDGPTDGWVLASEERSTDRSGTSWTRVAYGTTDAWVATESLRALSPDVVATDESGPETDESDTGPGTDPVTAEALGSTTIVDDAERQEAATDDDGLLLGITGVALALVIASLTMLRRWLRTRCGGA